MRNSMQKSIIIENNDQISEKNIKLGLGINRKTGRLQWCPGYCNLHRILIVIPATMLPLLLLFILATHLELMGTVHQEKLSEYSIMNSENQDEIASNIRDTRCQTVRFGVSETIDAEERELLKDVRTSFIPPDLVVIPPNCRPIDSDQDWSIENDSVMANNILTNTMQISEYLKRKRRDHNYNETISETILNILADNDEVVNEDDESPPWKLSSECDPQAHSELEASEISKSISSNCELQPSVPFHAFWKGEGTADKIRLTQAEIMKQYMDLSVDPCDDFYQYACGNWEKLNPIPKDKAAYDTFEMLRESLDSVLQDLLKSNKTTSKITNKNLISNNANKNEEDVVKFRLKRNILKKRDNLNNLIRNYVRYKRRRRYSGNISGENITPYVSNSIDRNYSDDAEKKAQDLYQSCMDYELIAKRGIQPLLELLTSLGGWPVLDDSWIEDNFDWLNLTANLRLYNNDIFLAEWVGPDIKNSEENIIQFDQTSLGLPTRDYFLQASNHQYLEAYEIYMKTIIQLLGSNTTNSEKVALEIIEFETALARITSSPEERTNVSVLYKRMSLGALQTLIPEIEWSRYLAIILERPVNSSEMIVMFATNYMKDLVKLLATSEQRTISNYLLWRFVRHRINNLDDRFQDAKQQFYKVLFGREQSPPRWKNCVSQVNANMGMAVGAMFVRKYFDENSKKDTLTMTNELQEAFREILITTDWIDNSTKLLAESKVNAMSLKIGYPDYILSKDELNEKYEDLDIDSTKYFENTLKVLIHLTRNEQNKLGQVVNKTVWHTAPAVVNAYYSRNKNQIMFPAGILQPPFYHRYFPKSLNYGGIGVVIGHELTHGFDDKGRLFDRDGNLHRWWTDLDIEGFHERARCLISQYGNYTVSEVGIAVDGENTQGENIADNGGIKQAFHAYTKWISEHSDAATMKHETLPGIDATNTQLFFLNFAQVWCGAMRPEATRNKLKTAVHSPGKFRVIGTLSNSVDFAKEYDCPVGSPMNPEQKCSVW